MEGFDYCTLFKFAFPEWTGPIPALRATFNETGEENAEEEQEIEVFPKENEKEEEESEKEVVKHETDDAVHESNEEEEKEMKFLDSSSDENTDVLMEIEINEAQNTSKTQTFCLIEVSTNIGCSNLCFQKQKSAADRSQLHNI